VGISGFGLSRYLILIGEKQMLIKGKAETACRVGCFDRRVMELG